MGVSGMGIPGAFLGGVDKVKEEIAGLEKKRQELYGHIALDGKIKEAEKSLESLNKQIEEAKAKHSAIVSKTGEEIKKEAEIKRKDTLKKLDDAKADLTLALSKKNALEAEFEVLLIRKNEEYAEMQKNQQWFTNEIEKTSKVIKEKEEALVEKAIACEKNEKEVNLLLEKNNKLLTDILANKEEFKKEIAENKKLIAEAKEKKAEVEVMLKRADKELYNEKNKFDDYAREIRKKLVERDGEVSAKESKLKEELAGFSQNKEFSR